MVDMVRGFVRGEVEGGQGGKEKGSLLIGRRLPRQSVAVAVVCDGIAPEMSWRNSARLMVSSSRAGKASGGGLASMAENGDRTASDRSWPAQKPLWVRQWLQTTRGKRSQS